MMVGASREAVVRGLAELRREGVIRTSRRKMVVLRPDQLGPRAEGNNPSPSIPDARA